MTSVSSKKQSKPVSGSLSVILS